MPASPLNADALFGKIAFDREGNELGEIEAVYLNPQTQAPEWVAVRTGRSETSLAPLAGAEPGEEGVRLAVEEKLVRNAPGRDTGPPSAELSEEEEAELYHYYAIEYSGGADQPPPD
jgi:hypothetical protein